MTNACRVSNAWRGRNRRRGAIGQPRCRKPLDSTCAAMTSKRLPLDNPATGQRLGISFVDFWPGTPEGVAGHAVPGATAAVVRPVGHMQVPRPQRRGAPCVGDLPESEGPNRWQVLCVLAVQCVGWCHRDRDRPLGEPVDKELRHVHVAAHIRLTRFGEERLIKADACACLPRVTGIHAERCCIGLLKLDECRYVGPVVCENSGVPAGSR